MLVLSTLEDGYSPAAVLTLALASVALVACAWRLAAGVSRRSDL
jgi:hypothetical protein